MVVITLIFKSLAKLLIDGSLSPTFNSSHTFFLLVNPYLDSAYKKGYLVQEIFRFVFIVIVIVLFIVEYFYRKTTVSPRTPKEVFLTPDFVLSIAVFLLFLAVFIIRLVYNDKNDMFEIGKFHNTYFKAKRMNYANNLDGIILMFQVLKLILFIRVTNYASLVYPFFVESFKVYLYYFIFILTLLLGFAVGGKLLYGYDEDGNACGYDKGYKDLTTKKGAIQTELGGKKKDIDIVLYKNIEKIINLKQLETIYTAVGYADAKQKAQRFAKRYDLERVSFKQLKTYADDIIKCGKMYLAN